eukprot:scaffold48308_cov39-Phaeocystis_antarctica.AAC.2
MVRTSVAIVSASTAISVALLGALEQNLTQPPLLLQLRDLLAAGTEVLGEVEGLGLQLTQCAVALRHDSAHALALLPRHCDAAALGDEGGAQLGE